MSREILTSAVFESSSAEEFHDSQGGWIDLGLDDDIDERAERGNDFKEKYDALIAELGEGIDDSFELYGFERSIPYSVPRKVIDTLGLIAAAKANVTSIDQFVRVNEGKVFQQIGVFAFTAGVFAEGGVTIEKHNGSHRLIFPTVTDSVYSAYYDSRQDDIRIIEHKPENLGSYAHTFDDGLQVRPTEALLRSDTFWETMSSHVPVFSIGEVPQGPFFNTDSPKNLNYQANLEFYEKHLAAIRILTQLATDPTFRSSVEFVQ
jgi:hypothetical protein